MKKLMIILLIVMAFTSCRTAQQRADRYIQKAIALDPTVIENIQVKTSIVDTIPFYKEIIVPKEEDSRSINIDSLRAILSDSIKTVILTSGKTEVTAKPGKNAGEIEFSLNRPEQDLSVDSLLEYQKEIIVPGKEIKIRVPKKAYTYTWFWILLIYAGVSTFLFVKTLSTRQ